MKELTNSIIIIRKFSFNKCFYKQDSKLSPTRNLKIVVNVISQCFERGTTNNQMLCKILFLHKIGHDTSQVTKKNKNNAIHLESLLISVAVVHSHITKRSWNAFLYIGQCGNGVIDQWSSRLCMNSITRKINHFGFATHCSMLVVSISKDQYRYLH